MIRCIGMRLIFVLTKPVLGKCCLYGSYDAWPYCGVIRLTFHSGCTTVISLWFTNNRQVYIRLEWFVKVDTGLPHCGQAWFAIYRCSHLFSPSTTGIVGLCCNVWWCDAHCLGPLKLECFDGYFASLLWSDTINLYVPQMKEMLLPFRPFYSKDCFDGETICISYPFSMICSATIDFKDVLHLLFFLAIYASLAFPPLCNEITFLVCPM